MGVGSFDKDVRPQWAHLPVLSTPGGRVEFRPDVDRVIKYDRFYKIVREALGSDTSGAIDDITPVCRYVIVRSDGRVVKVGTAPIPRTASTLSTSRAASGSAPTRRSSPFTSTTTI